MHVLCAPSTDSPNSLPIFDDKQTILLSNNTVVSTYDFSVQQKHPDAQNLQMGNYIVFVDKYHKTKMYTLMSHDGDDLTHTWHAEDVGLDLLNESSEKWDYTGQPHDIAWYLNNLVLKDSGWTIGINEASTLTRALKFDGETDTQLRRLGDIANQFDGAEVDFTIEMNGAQVTKQVVNIYKKVGSAVTQGRYIDSVNLKSLHSSGSIGDLITAVKPFGTQMDMPEGQEGEAPRITIADVAYDDGRYYSPKGHAYLYDREARQQWSRFKAYNYANQGEFDGYIVGSYTYDTKDPNELLKRALTELKSRNKPSETYEANLLDINADIGDYVQIAHSQYNPPIYLSARVEQVENCYTANGQDTGILGDYQELESQIDPRIKEMIDQLADQIKPNYTWIRYAKDDKGTGMTSTPTADTKYVAIVSNKPTGVPSDNPADYAGHWQLIQGQDGTDGIPGPKGADGKTPYFHSAWANSADGKTGFSTTDSVNKSYLGTYTDFTQADSADPTKYAWSLIKGADGVNGKDGIPGKPGVDGKTPYFHTAWADSADGNVNFSLTDATNRGYLGTYTDFVQADSTDTTKYAWSLIKGRDGSDGAPGKPGVDGKTPYFHQAWADSKDGKVNFSTTDPTNRGYLGTYSDFTQADSTDPSKYFWVELVGNLVIGGRNYLLNSNQYLTGAGKNQKHVTDISGDTLNKLRGKQVTISVDIDYTNARHEVGLKCRIGIEFSVTYESGYEQWLGVWKNTTAGESFSGRISQTMRFKDEPIISTFAEVWAYTQDIFDESSVGRPKLEIGTTFTDWSPAPEDTQGQIDKVNDGLGRVEGLYNSILTPVASITAPPSPKEGQGWWVLNAAQQMIGFKIYKNGAWGDAPIQQSAMNIGTLNGNIINGATINSSNFNVAYDETAESSGRPFGPYFKGTQVIKNGSYLSNYQVKGSTQTGYTYLTPDGLQSRINNNDGSLSSQVTMGRGSLSLQDATHSGDLYPGDVERTSREVWITSDGVNKPEVGFFKQFRQVWLDGLIALNAASAAKPQFLFKLKNSKLYPKTSRYISLISLRDVPDTAILRIDPDGSISNISCPVSNMRFVSEGIFYTIGD